MEKFTSLLIKEIEKELSDVKIISQKVAKNNSVVLNGLTFSNDKNIAPIIYIDKFYDDYKTGKKAISDISKEVVTIYNANKLDDDFDVNSITDFNLVKDKITTCVINKELNVNNDFVSYEYLDLLVIFKININENASITVKKAFLDIWGISLEELKEIAFKNTARIGHELLHISELIPLPFDNTTPMYVATNYKKLFGASIILFTEFFKEYSKRLDDDLIIIPSSIHELIVLPATYFNNFKQLANVIIDVNTYELKKEEILANHPYIYKREFNSIEIV